MEDQKILPYATKPHVGNVSGIKKEPIGELGVFIQEIEKMALLSRIPFDRR